MKLPEGDRLQDAIDMWHDDSWSGCPGGKPVVADGQMPYVLAVLREWFREEFFPRKLPSVPKEHQTSRPKSKVDRGSQKLGRDLVYARSGGWCEIALPGLCAGLAREWHHRLNRSQGGRWDASNGLHLCGLCHDDVTNRDRERAKRMGWAVVPGVTPPVEVPVLRRDVWVLLDDAGSFEPYKEVA